MPEKRARHKGSTMLEVVRPCHVFTPEFIAQTRSKYTGKPQFQWPDYVRFVTDPDLQEQRDVIEAWVDQLLSDERVKIISRLRSPKSYVEARNELAVGNYYRAAGNSLRYEIELPRLPPLSALTPDWLVCPRGHGPFVVDVVATNPPDERTRFDAAWMEFYRRLEQTPGDSVVAIIPHQSPLDALPPVPSGGEIKKMVEQVTRWLSSNPGLGTFLSLPGCNVQLLHRSSTFKNITPSYLGGGVFVDPSPLRVAVKDKASKYAEVLAERSLPLVVSVVCEFLSGRNSEDLEEAVFGEWKVLDHNGQPVHEPVRTSGLFANYPLLSAVTWAERGAELDAKVFHNPQATFPLDPSVFLASPQM